MTEQNFEEALGHLVGGSAICFLGAGFSTAGTDQSDTPLPSTAELVGEIKTLIGHTENDGASLSDLADYCQGDSNLVSKLQHFLIGRLTLTKPSRSQAAILQAPWRAIFTTNFDDLSERALRNSPFQIVTPLADSHRITSDKTPIYYLHGRALDILEGRGDASIVLSETNYLDLKQKNVGLYATFINELTCANRVFFIGYSLRDMDIAKRLFSIGETLQWKSIVICGPSESTVAKTRLQKFGEVHAIGLEGFAKKLTDAVAAKQNSRRDSFSFVRPLGFEAKLEEVTREDVDRLIISGEFDFDKFAAQTILPDAYGRYCIVREERLAEIFDGMSKGVNRFIVSSDIGNGKTTFLGQLAYSAHGRGYEVFHIKSRLTEIFEELERRLARGTRQMFLIDDVIRNRDVAKFIGARLSSLSVLICSARETLDDAALGEMSALLGGSVREVRLNTLTAAELQHWNELLERWGYWEERISLSEADRFQFLKSECGSETRSIVVSIFKSSRIAAKINEIVSYFLRTNPRHLRAFVAILICSLCQKHVDWEKVVQWLSLDEYLLRKDLQAQQIFDFMSGRRDWYRLTSSQLAGHIFKHFDFDSDVLIEVYTNIVRETANCADDRRLGFDSTENLKELMKYRFLTHIFGDTSNALACVEAIYKRLSAVPRLRRNDQFWLQYAMSNIENDNIAEAEGYIKTALGIAEQRGADYSNHQILDQRIRLLFLKNTKSKLLEPDEIELALTDLKYLLGRADFHVVYPLRSAFFIENFLEARAEDLSEPLAADLMNILELMQEEIGAGELERSKRGETEKLRRTIRNSVLILKNI